MKNKIKHLFLKTVHDPAPNQQQELSDLPERGVQEAEGVRGVERHVVHAAEQHDELLCEEPEEPVPDELQRAEEGEHQDHGGDHRKVPQIQQELQHPEGN